MRFEFRIIKIQIWQDYSEQRFRLVQTRFESLDILRCRIAAAIRWLVISTFYERQND